MRARALAVTTAPPPLHRRSPLLLHQDRCDLLHGGVVGRRDDLGRRDGGGDAHRRVGRLAGGVPHEAVADRRRGEVQAEDGRALLRRRRRRVHRRLGLGARGRRDHPIDLRRLRLVVGGVERAPFLPTPTQSLLFPGMLRCAHVPIIPSHPAQVEMVLVALFGPGLALFLLQAQFLTSDKYNKMAHGHITSKIYVSK